MATKKCTKCKKIKDVEEFPIDRTKKDGRYYACRECKSKRDTKRYRTNLPNELLKQARKRAKENGLEFSLVVEDITVPKRCPYLGTPLIVAKGHPTDNSPTLDRIDSTRGYSKDNIIVCSWRANAIKRNATSKELFKIAAKLRDLEKQQEIDFALVLTQAVGSEPINEANKNIDGGDRIQTISSQA